MILSANDLKITNKKHYQYSINSLDKDIMSDDSMDVYFFKFINKPLIEDINVPDMTNFEFQSNQNDIIRITKLKLKVP